MSTNKKGNSFNFLPMDLSGKLIIKARLGEDIRRVPIHNEDITYDELLLMLQRVFKGKLNNTDDVTLKYCDEDGDLITIMDSSDLNLAKQINRLLRIKIFIHGKEPLPILDASEVQEVRKELISIRDKVNTLLDAIDGAPKGSSTASEEVRVQPPAAQSSRSSGGDTTVKADAPVEPSKPTASITIFDPLKPSTPQSQGSSSQNSSSTSHLFTQSPGSGEFLAGNTSSTKPGSYPTSSQPSGGYSPQQQQQQGTSGSGPYSSNQGGSNQVGGAPPQQSIQPTQQQQDSGFYSQQQQQKGYSHLQQQQPQSYPSSAASPGPSAPPTSSYQPQQQQHQQHVGYPHGNYGQPQQQPPQQHQQQQQYGFQTTIPGANSGYKPANSSSYPQTQQQQGYNVAPYNY